MSRAVIRILAVAALASVSCSVRYPPTLESDFIDPVEYGLKECAADSISVLLASLRIDDGNPEAWRRLSVCYRAIGTPESRLESARAIDRAIELDPGNPLYHVERGLTMYARQFTGSALRSFERAIELDPGFFPAWYNLGRIHQDMYLRNMTSERELDRSIWFYRRADNIYGAHEETLFSLGLLQYLRGRPDLCRGFAERGAIHYPGSYRFRLLSGCAALEVKKFDEASAEFRSALALMDARTRFFFEDIALLLPEEERITYDNLDERNREEANRIFWTRNDPTPATPLNERQLEHYRRVFLTGALLTSERLGLEGLQTARGRALVSYGLPDAILLDMGSGLDGSFISWNYFRGGRMFQLFFQDEFLSGNYHIPIDRRFYDYAMITEGILQSIDQMYVYPVEHLPLPVAVESVQFRGTEEETRVDFALAVPDSCMGAGGGPWSLDFTLYDHDWRVFRTLSRGFDPDTLNIVEKPSGAWKILETGMLLPPLALESSYAIEIRGGEPPARGLFRGPMTIRDLGGRSLSLSGLRFSLPGPDGCTGSIDPLPSYTTGSSICVYYEIYNLAAADRLSRYRLTYSVVSPEKIEGPSGTWSWITSSAYGREPEPTVRITSSIEQSTAQRTTQDELVIDIGSLEPGRFRLLVEVDDLVSGFSVSGWREFAVVPKTGSR